MPEFATERVVNHSAADMFELVADVEKYPEFVPLCESLTVRSERTEAGKRVLIADMAVGYKLVRETFTSRVTLDRAALQIGADPVNGPFRIMENRWRFEPLGEHSCRVRFHISYEFRSRALALVMGSMFDRVFSRFAAAFEARADTVYGRGGAGS